MSSSQPRFPEAETPVHGYFYSMVELGVMRVFVEHQIFDLIPDDGISVSELAKKSGVEFNLLERLSNFLVAAQVLSSPRAGYITLTPESKMFQQTRAKLFYSHIFDAFMGSAVRWPEYFRANGLAEPQRSNRSPFGLGAGYPDKSFYEVLEMMPERAQAFNSTMAIGLGDMPITGIYDFSWVAEYAEQHGGGRALIVDVGGGKGQALKAIIEETPGIPAASCVLQDQASVTQEASKEGGILESVKKVGSSFFDEQPTKGALVYYIRRVLNDWPDDECVIILGKIRAACALDSRVLISENLLPDTPSVPLAAADLWMMNFAGKRRNERMFNEIASRAGFRVSSISRDKTSNSAIIEMLPV
ncbi:O-methyltransferase-domain-containing protein [Thelonectria olida]|uniref:O-methyltransferase-domain-containing protein n=1 Tax=Thelonectria olida TaxID=1576542 RepID=A0A9P9AJ83_9HYPO|nr:O-methyltransferase-domain-containing protein [Thelonectria olida]